MEKKEENVLERVLDEKSFEDAKTAIEGGKETESLTNPELIENLIESFKDKTVQAPVEVIITSSIFLNARELMGVMEVLKHTVRMKMIEEIKDRADKGESTGFDAMAAVLLAASMKKD